MSAVSFLSVSSPFVVCYKLQLLSPNNTNYYFTITNPFHSRSSKRIIFIRWFDSESSVQSWSCIRHIFFLYSNGILFKISVNFATLVSFQILNSWHSSVFTRFFKIISWNWQFFTSYNLRGPVRLPLFWKNNRSQYCTRPLLTESKQKLSEWTVNFCFTVFGSLWPLNLNINRVHSASNFFLIIYQIISKDKAKLIQNWCKVRSCYSYV